MQKEKQILVGKDIKFERIRRITGYLTGTVDRWNKAKQHELQNRTTHNMEVNNNDTDSKPNSI